MRRKKVRRWNPDRTFARRRRETVTLRRLQSRLTGQLRRRLRKAVAALDGEFLLEKAEIVKDTTLEILRHRKKTPNTLLQRNLWSSLDAIAFHLDQSGFTRVFQQVAPRLITGTRLDDPDIVSLEWQLTLDYLGLHERSLGKLGLPRREIEAVARMAEREKLGACGLPNITRKDFSFREVFAKFCGRPDGILQEIHHSPQGLKVVALIVIEVLNLVAGVLGVLTIIGWWLGVGIFIVSTIIVIVVACLGC
jgi:hypothetical protein